MKKHLALFIFCLCSITTWAQSVKISGEIRPRAEYGHGVSTLAFEGQDPAVQVTQRTRLNLSYTDQWFTSFVVFQDVRRWGNQAQLVSNEEEATSIHQAWAEAFFLKDFAVRVGRQELAYDNHRILGNVGWAQQARSHDLAVVKYNKEFTIHLGIAHHDDGDLTQDIYNGPDAYRNMQFLWFNKKWNQSSLSFLVLNNGIPYNKELSGSIVTDQVDKYSQTIGPYFTWNPENWFVETNAYVQTGQNAVDQDILAYEFLINGMYTFNEKWSAGAAFEWLSGTDYDETEEDNSFSPLYGTNHKFNGYMDYFYVGNDGNNAGLLDATVKGKYKNDKISGTIDVHGFWTERIIEKSDENYLGIEVDLGFGYDVSKTFQLKAGYSQLFATETMELIKPGDKDATNNWGYVMLTFKPMFFMKE